MMIGTRSVILGVALVLIAYLRREPANIVLQETLDPSYDYIIGEGRYFHTLGPLRAYFI